MNKRAVIQVSSGEREQIEDDTYIHDEEVPVMQRRLEKIRIATDREILIEKLNRRKFRSPEETVEPTS